MLTVVPLSSQAAKAAELDVPVKKNSRNRLMADSLLKTKQISSFDKRRFIKLIGIADDDILTKIEENVNLLLFRRIQRPNHPDPAAPDRALL